MGNPVGWFEIYVDDMARARAFYEAMLGVTLTPLESPGIELWAFPMDAAMYGASKLTSLLQDSLGNGRRTLLFAAVPANLPPALVSDVTRFVHYRYVFLFYVAL